MQEIVKQWWEQNGRSFQEQSRIPIDIIYGPGAPNEDALQLIGPVKGKRVLVDAGVVDVQVYDSEHCPEGMPAIQHGRAFFLARKER